MWYVCDALYAVFYARVDCLVVHCLGYFIIYIEPFIKSV